MLPEQQQAAIDVPTVIAISCVVYATSTMLHEGAHAIVAWVVGGSPALVSTTDVRGDWSNVSGFGITAIGLSGSLVNWLLAGAGLWAAPRLRNSSSATRWGVWLAIAVNGFVPSMYMIVSPLAGFGDWMTVLQRWPGTLVWRFAVAGLGVASTLGWGRVVARQLAGLLGAASIPVRLRQGQRLVMLSWLAGGALAVCAAVLSPLGPGWAVGIGLGSSLGTTWPMLPIARFAATRNALAQNGIDSVDRHVGWLIAGLVVSAIFVGVFGPGLSFE